MTPAPTIETVTTSAMTMVSAAMPASRRLERGLTLVEVLIYTVVLSFLLLAVYQTNSFVQQQSIQSSQLSDLNYELDSALQKLRQTVQRSVDPVQILPAGAESLPPETALRYEDRNCLLARVVDQGSTATHAIGLVWVESVGAARLMMMQGDDCGALGDESAVELSKPIFLAQDGANWFVGQVAQSGTRGFTEIDFQYRARVGTSSISTSTELRRARLSTSTVTKPECRVAAPTPAWFIDRGEERIREARVSIATNFESGGERLGLVNVSGDRAIFLVDEQWDVSNGVLTLITSGGLRVSDWLRVFSDVKYIREPAAAALSDASPSKTIEFTLVLNPPPPAAPPLSHQESIRPFELLKQCQ